LFHDFDGRQITWGLNETPVIYGDLIYVTPGGRKYNMVALNRRTGAIEWSSHGLRERSAYCTPLLFEHNGRQILATHFESHLVGFDALTGEMLWSQYQPNEWSVHANTPLYYDGNIFYLSGWGQGGGMLEISPDGNSTRLKWTHKIMDSRTGGAVLVDGYIYGSGDTRTWSCLDWNTGQVMYTSEQIGNGVVIYADGMLYCYTEKGELALVKPDPSGFNVVSQTKVTLGSGQHWAHPVIFDGVLYLRHGRALIAYKIK
jgi:outer membrane protein assembly factor BamB